MTLVSAMTFAFGAAPVAAVAEVQDFSSFSDEAPAAQQSLSPQIASLSDQSLDALTELSDRANVPHGFDVDAAIAAAKREIGTVRPTGWSQPGECIVSARRWLVAGGAHWTEMGDPVKNYRGAVRLNISDAQPGDVVQYENIDYPTSWVTGVHTVLITERHDDGTFSIVESNNPAGSGRVSQNLHWTPAPPAGFRAVVWRF